MPKYRRIRRRTIGKQAVQHSATKITTSGPAVAPDSFIVLNPNIGARTVDGSAQNYSTDRDTEETVNIGDIVKYIHLFLQGAPRPAQGTDDDSIGWVEWAFLCVKQSDTAVPITNLGTNMLGDVCTKMFRNECIMTGMMPIGSQQANSQEIFLKIPKFKQKITSGDEWRFMTYTRDVSATSTEINSFKVNKGYMYKNYE